MAGARSIVGSFGSVRSIFQLRVSQNDPVTERAPTLLTTPIKISVYLYVQQA